MSARREPAATLQRPQQDGSRAPGQVEDENDDDYTSSSGASSVSSEERIDEDHMRPESSDAEPLSEATASDSEGDDADIVPALPPSQAPAMIDSAAATDLRSRIAQFLPQIRQANVELEGAGDLADRQVDQVGEGEEYVEMNLGLGVLEEKHGRQEGEIQVKGEPESDDDGSEEERNAEVVGIEEGALAKLKGEKSSPSTGKGKIEEIG